GGGGVRSEGLWNSVEPATALTNGVTALVLLLATAAVIDRLHAMMVREAGRARFDPLTGLSNRRACEERCAVEIARLQRRSGSLSVAFFDFDGLKQVNDVKGHAAALIHIATSAQAVLRPTDLLSRVGGGEFVLLLPGTAYDDATTHRRPSQGRPPQANR